MGNSSLDLLLVEDHDDSAKALTYLLRMYGHRVHDAVLASGAKESGATVHFVDEAFDRGAIIAQEKVPVHKGDTAETLAARVLEAEHRLLPKVVLDLARRIS